MDNVTPAKTSEKITNDALPVPVQPFDDEEEPSPPSVPIEWQLPAPPGGGSGRRPVARYFGAYGTAMVVSLPTVPVVVSVATIVIYLSNPHLANWLSLVLGAGSTLLAWLAVCFLLAPITYAENANAGSYGTLDSRLQQLGTRLSTIAREHPDDRDLSPYQRVALSEAFNKLEEISGDLYLKNSSLTWAMGSGYVNAWRKLHRAEEALVEIEPEEMVMRGAMHDNMAISGSQMSDRDSLLSKLLDAVKAIDTSMIRLFKLPHMNPAVAAGVSESSEVQELQKDVRQLQEDVRLLAHHIKVTVKIDPLADPAQTASESDDTGTRARASRTHAAHKDNKDNATRGRWMLREVKHALNEYRDRHFEWVIRTRNNLLGVTFVTGLGTHVLLCVAILSLASDPNSRSIIIAATSYYLVGAIAGLFARISQSVLTNIEADDYGFSLALILSRPLYSGLAGLGGVLVSSTVLSISTQNNLNPVLSVFTPGKLDFIIVAAAFGLTPGLILSGLQNQTTKMLSALSSSKTTNAGVKTGSSVTASVGSNEPDAGS